MKIIKGALLLALVVGAWGLAITSCSDRQTATPVMQSHYNISPNIVVYTYDNLVELNASLLTDEAAKNIEEIPIAVYGYATYHTNGRGLCTIHVVLPEYMEEDQRFRTLGHEVLHCIYGRFHE